MTLREELGQLSWIVGRYRSPKRVVAQADVIRRMRVPKLPRAESGRDEVWAVSVVRDEADIVVTTVTHLLNQGIDHVIIADSGSIDGTTQALASLAASDSRVHLALDGQPKHLQSEKITYLAHRAWRAGATWVLPFDADEFFFAKDSTVAEFLRSQSASIVHANFHHMVPTAPAASVDETTDFVLDASPSFPGKVAARSHPLLEFIPGNHGASRVGAVTSGLHIAHALYRRPEQVARKFRQGVRASEASDLTFPGEHWTRGSALTDAEIEEVWARISQGLPDARIDYQANGPMVSVRPLAWASWDPDGVLG